LYPRIHDPAALAGGQGEDRIQIEFGYFGNRFGEVGDAQQHLFDCLQINCRMSSIFGDQTIAFDSLDHLRSVPIGQRRDAELDIAKDLDVNLPSGRKIFITICLGTGHEVKQDIQPGRMTQRFT
jgi:hypothetical protein